MKINRKNNYFHYGQKRGSRSNLESSMGFILTDKCCALVKEVAGSRKYTNGSVIAPPLTTVLF